MNKTSYFMFCCYKTFCFCDIKQLPQDNPGWENLSRVELKNLLPDDEKELYKHCQINALISRTDDHFVVISLLQKKIGKMRKAAITKYIATVYQGSVEFKE